jgi:hypothetical protein
MMEIGFWTQWVVEMGSNPFINFFFVNCEFLSLIYFLRKQLDFFLIFWHVGQMANLFGSSINKLIIKSKYVCKIYIFFSFYDNAKEMLKCKKYFWFFSFLFFFLKEHTKFFLQRWNMQKLIFFLKELAVMHTKYLFI